MVSESDGEGAKTRLEELRSATGPLRAGGPRRLGAFYGIYWPRHLRELAANGLNSALTEQERAGLEDTLNGFEADFRKIAGAPLSLSETVSRLIVSAAIIGFYIPKEITRELRRQVWADESSKGGVKSGKKNRKRHKNTVRHGMGPPGRC